MLETQKFLREKSLEALQLELGIEFTYSECGNLVILNYSQINSPKRHPIVIECRGLILEVGTWEVAGRSFFRFFNYQE